MSERDRAISQIKAKSGGPSSFIINVTSLSGGRSDRENRDQRDYQRSKSINNDLYGCGGNDTDVYRPSRSRASSNSAHSDEIIYKMAPEAVDPAILSRGSLSHRRYTRSALLLLRDEGKSKLRPRCYNEPRVSSLSLWKTDGNYVHHNCVTSNGDRDRDRSCIIDQRNNRQSGGGLRDERGNSGNNSNQANPKNYDHRSISSSHLMPAFAKRRIVGSSLSGQNSNAGITSTSNGSNNTVVIGDSKERLKKDQQGSSLDNLQVVLSPQRKSMHLGCQMPPPTLNMGGSGVSHHSDREHAPVRERRIGSGRLLPREGDWVDYRSTTTSEKDAVVENETNYKYSRSTSTGVRYDYRGTEGGGNNNTGGNQSGRPIIERDQDHRNSNDNRSERYERRSYGRDFDRDSRGGSDNPSYSRRYIADNLGSSQSQPGGGSHYNDHRRRQYSDNRHNDEPEWFSGGPTSQHDTIELRGFDEPEESSSRCYKSDDGQSACGGAGTNGQRRVSESSSQASINTNVRHSTHNSNEAATIDDDVVVVNSTSPPPARSTPTKLISDSNNNNKEQQLKYDNNRSSSSTGRATKQNPPNNSFENIGDDISDEDGSVNGKDGKILEFNFDAFMNVDPLNNLLGGESKEDECTPGSRFSRWFSKQESERLSRQQNSANNEKSQRTSVNEDVNLNEMSDKYFAPISPASASNNNTNTQNNQQQQPNMLMEFLQRGKFNTISTASTNFGNNATSSGMIVDNLPPIAILGAGKLYSDKSQPAGIIPSVEELEARMRKTNDGEIQPTLNVHGIGHLQNPLNHLQATNQQSQIGRFGSAVPHKIIQHQQPPQQQPQQQDMEAFKKLLEQLVPVSSASNKSINNAQTLQFPQVVSSSHRQTQQQSQFGSLPTPAISTNSSKTDVLTKYIQQQQLFQQRQQNIRSQLTRNEILNKPEAQYILQGVARGDFTYQSLLQQFNGPQVRSRAHEVIGAVLNHLSSTNSRASSPSLMIGSQQVLSPVPQQISVGVLGTQQGSQSGSNNTVSGMSQRIPSPRELQFHTQSIMQSALIKKKLEEQQENYRRRQEIQKHITPNNQAAVLPQGILQSSQQQLTNPGNAQTDVLGRGHEFVIGQRNSPPPLNSRQLQLQQQIQMQQMGKLPTPTLQHPSGTIAVGNSNGLVDGDARGNDYVMRQQSSPPPLNMRQIQLQHQLQTQQQMRKLSASQLALTGAVGSASGQIDDDGRTNDFVVSQQNSPPPLNSRQLQLQLQIQLQQQIRKQSTAATATSISGITQRQISSPTPLAFTPTSVLRKMTAEKDNFQATTSSESGKNFTTVNKTTIQNMLIQSQRLKITSPPQSQPRMILGGGNQQQLALSQVHHSTQLSQANNSCNQQNSTQSAGSGTSNLRNNPMKWNSAIINQQVQTNKPLGRPILKGGPSSIPPSCSGVLVSQSQQQQQQPLSPQIIQQQQPQMVFASKIEFQQMQQQRQRNKNATSQQSQSKKLPSQISQQSQQNSQQQTLFMSQLQQQQQLTQFIQQRQQQQQQRAALQRAQYQQMQQQLQQQPNSAAAGKTAANQVPSEHNLNSSAISTVGGSNHNNGGAIINYQRDGGLSPTSNQLARWFSPELLAQASAGKLPSLNMGQALSLEEFERSIQHSSAAVHN